MSDVSLEERVAQLPEDEREAILADVDMASLEWDWSWRARPSQLLPILPGDPGYGWSMALILAGRGFGKALTLDTNVMTPQGWRQLADIEAGDFVFDEHGRPCRVLVAHAPAERDTYRLTFSDGATIDACDQHQWVTWTHQERKQFRRKNPGAETFPADWAARVPVRDTAQLLATLRLDGRGDLNHCIPTAGMLQHPRRDFAIHPYVLGAWLGDGSSATAAITVADTDADEVLAKLAACGAPLTREIGRRDGARCATYLIGGAPLRRDPNSGRMLPNGSLHSLLRRAGLLNNKHIPPAYLLADTDQRIDLLAGLLDTDGSIGVNGHVEFCSTSPSLAYGVVELARSLGQKPVLAKSRSVLRGVDHGPRFRVTWRPTFNPFSLRRKMARFQPLGKQGWRSRHRMITAIEPIGRRMTRCLTVDSPHRMWLAGEALIPTHNTLTGSEWIRAMDAAWPALGRDHGRLRVALLGRTSADVRDVMLEGPSGLLNIWPPSLRDRVHWYPSRRRLDLPGGAMCTVFSSEEPAQLRGPQVHISWADEVATYKQLRSAEDDATAWENLRIATRLGSLPQVLATTTPKRVPLLRQLLREYDNNPSKILLRRGRTRDNRSLSNAYLDVLESLYGGTALGRQELEGEMLDEVAGATTSEGIIDRYRVKSLPANMPWIKVVSVDPTVAERPHDECGIVVLYITRTWPVLHRHAVVVDDLSGHYAPAEWGDIVLRAAHEHGATVIAETNQGGNLVFQMLRQSAQHSGLPMPPMKEVWSSKSKAVRAEPISGAYAKGRIHHLNVLAEYESQLTSWVYGDSGYSPDRMDAGIQGLAAGLFPEAVTSGMPGSTVLHTVAKQHLTITPATAMAANRRGMR